MWNIDVSVAGRAGQFRAVCRETGLERVSRDPEYDICHALARTGVGDGPVYFWRCGKISMRFSSLGRSAAYRIQEGDRGGIRLVKRRDNPVIPSNMREFVENTVRGTLQSASMIGR